MARAERDYPLSIPRPGWAEQDPEDWWRATEAALDDLGVQATTIGLSGQMHGLVALDERERVLRPAILWNDQRTAAECAEIEERVGLERLIELTGNRALTGFTAPKLLWLRRHEPQTYARIRHVLLPKDYVRLRLEGRRAIDAADASGTLLFDVATAAGATRCSLHWSCRASGCRRSLSPPRSVRPATRRGRARRGHRRAWAALDRARHLRRRLRRACEYRREPEARLHAFCHAVPGRGTHGRHALRRRLAPVAARRFRLASVRGGAG